MIYGYIRVSTEEQNLENQKKAISEKYEIDEWVEEKVSGTVDYTKRNLGELIDKLKLDLSKEPDPMKQANILNEIMKIRGVKTSD